MVRLLCVSLCLAATPGGARDPDAGVMERALAAGSRGELQRANELANQAAASCGSAEDSVGCRLATHILLSRNFALRSLYPLSLDQARQAMAVARSSTKAAQLSTQLIVAGAAARAGEFEEAEAAIAAGRQLADELAAEAPPEEAHDMQLLRGMFGGPQALIYTARGERVRAAGAQRTLVKTLRSFDRDHPNLAVELMTLADLQEDAADPAGARESYAEAIALAQRHHNVDVRDKARAALVRLDAAAAE